jgi:N-formylglutamate amidohydrolase
MLVQRPARAWIDLNRAESDRDPRIDEGVSPMAQPIESPKLRSGLGLIPRRAGRAGDLLRRRLSNEEVIARIRADHRPYHDALGRALAAARARFGAAVLLDLHSMPPPDHAEIVFGDRFGRTAAGRFVNRIEAIAEAGGFAHALNTPYSGGHILERHAAPANGVHAIQIEWSRALYLDAAMDAPGPGLAHAARTLRAMLDALADEACAANRLQAAAE